VRDVIPEAVFRAVQAHLPNKPVVERKRRFRMIPVRQPYPRWT
jgi:hypothetical protein